MLYQPCHATVMSTYAPYAPNSSSGETPAGDTARGLDQAAQSSQYPAMGPSNQHQSIPLTRSFAKAELEQGTRERFGRTQAEDEKLQSLHEDGLIESSVETTRLRRRKGHAGSNQASNTSNATFSHLVNVVNGAPTTGSTARSQTELFTYPHPAELLPTPQVSQPPHLSDSDVLLLEWVCMKMAQISILCSLFGAGS